MADMYLPLRILFLISLLYVIHVIHDDCLYDSPAFASLLAPSRVKYVSTGDSNPRIQVKVDHYTRWPGITRKRIAFGHLMGPRMSYYGNSTATYRSRLLLLFDIELNPGPDQPSETDQRKLKCLYLNSRSLVNKAKYLDAMESVNDHDLIAVTETWLNPSIRDSELLINTSFHIHRRDRESGEPRGGVLLALRHHLKSIRRSDLETEAELIAC